MYALEANRYTAAWADLGKNLTRPAAILVISAHWLTRGVWATATHDPLTLVPALFPETSIECRNLLRVLGFNPLTIEVRGYLFTAVRGFIPNIERWKAHAVLTECPPQTGAACQ